MNKLSLADDGQSLLLHLQTGPDERAHTLTVIIADWLTHIVVETTVAVLINLILRHIRRVIARTETADLTATGERNGLIGIYLYEVTDNSVIAFHTGIAETLVEIAEAIALEQAIGEHAAGRSLEIVARTIDIENVVP